jgi:hypothetical protein
MTGCAQETAASSSLPVTRESIGKKRKTETNTSYQRSSLSSESVMTSWAQETAASSSSLVSYQVSALHSCHFCKFNYLATVACICMQQWQNRLLVWASNRVGFEEPSLLFFFLDCSVFLQTLRIYAHGLLSLIAINCDACVFDKKKYKKCFFFVLYTANTLIYF